MMKLITFNFVDVSSLRLWRRASSIRLEHVKFAGIAAVMLLAAVSVRLCDRRKALLHEVNPLYIWFFREDDQNWPKKNIVGKQELEIRIGNEHIAFEVRI